MSKEEQARQVDSIFADLVERVGRQHRGLIQAAARQVKQLLGDRQELQEVAPRRDTVPPMPFTPAPERTPSFEKPKKEEKK